MCKLYLRQALVAALLCSAGFSASYADGFSLPGPIKVQAGPLGPIEVQGVLSGMGFGQTNPSGSGLNGKDFGAAVTNGIVVVNKNTGLIQFSLEAGAYNYPSLGEPFTSTGSNTSGTTALPVAYITIAPTKQFSVNIGQLPSLLGYTGTLTFQRMNIEGGFPWYLQTTFSRGVQINYSYGPIAASVSWNDGYYSNRYNVISGLVTYTINSQNSVSIYGSGNAGHTGNINSEQNYSNNSYVTSDLPLDNSDLYGIYYTYSGKRFSFIPEVQYVYTPKNAAFGTTESSYNISAMIHADYYLTSNWSIAAGIDYEYSSSQRTPGQSYYFGYGPGSSAIGVMLTPTYTDGDYFIRDELSYVRLTNFTTGFGNSSTRPDQIRDILETGFWF